MTNDKLPEEMQEQIKAEAGDQTNIEDERIQKRSIDFGRRISHLSGYEIGYIAGATAWAPWKVKCDELAADNERLRGWKIEAVELLTKINSYAHKHLEIKLGQCAVDFVIAQSKERDEMKQQAQRMADALEWIKNQVKYSPGSSWHDIARMMELKAIETLDEFKDGTKEVPKEIEYMPIHPDDANKFDCPTKFPMHLLNEGQAQSNHGQTLKRLKERGGLSVREILAIVGKKNWSYYGSLSWSEAIKMLNDILTNPTK